jgi:MscS family membrane protein
MKEVLDRIELPPWEQIPDEAMVAAQQGGMNQWTMSANRNHAGATERKDCAKASGCSVPKPMIGQLSFYRLVKHLPYKAGATEGLYRLFVSEPGPLIPRALVRGAAGLDAGPLRGAGRVAMDRSRADARPPPSRRWC